MKRYVIDSCVLARVSLQDKYEDSAKARRLVKLAILGDVELLAPALLLFEVNNILATYDLSEEQYQKALDETMGLVTSGIIRIIGTDQSLLEGAWQMSRLDTRSQGYVSSYDATFHTLALQRNAVFLTTDNKHVRKVEEKYGSVLLYSDLDV